MTYNFIVIYVEKFVLQEHETLTFDFLRLQIVQHLPMTVLLTQCVLSVSVTV